MCGKLLYSWIKYINFIVLGCLKYSIREYYTVFNKAEEKLK